MKVVKKVALLIAIQMSMSVLPIVSKAEVVPLLPNDSNGGINVTADAEIQPSISAENSVNAVESKISGTLKPGYKIVAEHTSNGSYAWYRCNNTADNGTLIEGVVSDTYTLKNVDGGKYLKFVVTTDGVISETIVSKQIDMPLDHKFAYGEVNKYWEPASSPKENTFVIGGRKFILLDSFNDMNSSYYVCADEVYGNRPYWGGNQAFDPNGADAGRTSTFLNKAFLTEGNGGKKLPAEIINNIDRNHLWITEAGATDGACPNDYTFNAGVSLLSLTELRQYKDKIGYNVGNYIIMRSGSTVAWDCMICTCEDGVIRQIGMNDGNSTLRPSFYLKNDFFKTVKLDLATTGDSVKAALRSRYTEAEMGIYSKAELKEIGFGKISEMTGKLTPGYTVTADMINAGSSYAWYRCDSENDAGALISGITSRTYTIKNADGGKFLRVESKNGDKVIETLVSGRVDNALINDISGDVALEGFPNQTPPENLFRVDSDATLQNFILLDTAASKTSSFFVYSNETVGKACYYRNQKFIPELDDHGVLSHALNHQYYNGEWGDKKLPVDIKRYIDNNHTWLTEGGSPNADCPDDYIFTAPITLLSLTELRKYAPKIGSFSGYYVTLRTGSKADAGQMLKTDANSFIGAVPIANNGEVRPCFWMGENFFKEVKLDLLNTGANVKKAIRERYSMSELSAIYDANELIALGYDTTACNIFHQTYKGENNTEITELRNAGASVTSSATVASYGKPTTVTMIVAIYNDKGDMIKAEVLNDNIIAGQEKPMSVTVNLSGFEIGKGYKAVTYFWDGLATMVPISKSYTL